MRIGFVGDVNGNYEMLNNICKDGNLDYIVTLGNFGIAPDSSTFGNDNFQRMIFHKQMERFHCVVQAAVGQKDNLGLANKYASNKLFFESLLVIDDVYHYERDSIIIIPKGYKPESYHKKELHGKENRYFNDSIMEKVVKSKILCMHDFIYDRIDGNMIYNDDFARLIDKVDPDVILIGKYGWFTVSDYNKKNLVFLPKVTDGYFWYDSEKSQMHGVKTKFTLEV